MKRLCLLALVLSVSCDRADFSNKLHLDAEIASREGRLPDAAATLERALRFDPADQVALERLVLLQLRMDNPARALALATTDTGLRARSGSLRNARVVAALRSNGLAAGLHEARALQAVNGLSQETERELLDAIVTDARRDARSLALSEQLPERWLTASCERLLQSSDVEHAAQFFLARPERERTSPAGTSIKRLLLERAYREDFAVTQETLDMLTQAPKSATEYLGRLEYARRRGDHAEAARLDPSAEQLSPPYVAAWQLGHARMAARRADWYGVLARTSGAADADARNAARRQALRCVAYLKLGDRPAAQAELEAWLSDPTAAQAWSVTLLLPEVDEAKAELVELRRVVDKSRARRFPTR
jgi:tetratricopeptide (TPR) repeat protein